MEVPTRYVSRRPLPGWREAVVLLCALGVRALGCLLTRALIASDQGPTIIISSSPEYFPLATSLDTITLGPGFLLNLGAAGANVHSG